MTEFNNVAPIDMIDLKQLNYIRCESTTISREMINRPNLMQAYERMAAAIQDVVDELSLSPEEQRRPLDQKKAKKVK